MRRLMALLAVCLVAHACGNSPTGLPIGDPLTPPPVDPFADADPWNLTALVTAQTGEACDLATSGDILWDLWVERSGAQLWIRYGNEHDLSDYVGSVQANDFTAVQRAPIYTLVNCRGVSTTTLLTGRMTGRFSDDGRSLTADQIVSYTMQAGVAEVHLRWTATAR